MGGVDERVKGFVENWRETHCAICQGPLEDGKFIVIDKVFYCLECNDGTRRPGDAEIKESV